MRAALLVLAVVLALAGAQPSSNAHAASGAPSPKRVGPKLTREQTEALRKAFVEIRERHAAERNTLKEEFTQLREKHKDMTSEAAKADVAVFKTKLNAFRKKMSDEMKAKRDEIVPSLASMPGRSP